MKILPSRLILVRLCSERSARAAFWEFRASVTSEEKYSKKFWASLWYQKLLNLFFARIVLFFSTGWIYINMLSVFRICVSPIVKSK